MKIFGLNITTDAKKPVIKRQARGQYRIVDGSQSMISPSSQETRSEDEILSPSKRAKLLDLTRNLVRNSSLFNTILGQLTTNVISSCGGKVILNFRDEEISRNIKKYFAEYTRNTDFYTGDTFNRLLKRVLREYIIGGDCVLLFDDNLIENSGKILLFESQEIVNTTKEAIEKHYGKGAYQSQGKIYSKFGRHIGTVVSRSERGKEEADPTKCFFLHRDPDANPVDEGWYHFSCAWREGRGVSQAASAISTIHQLEDLVASELMSARRNSQIFCWLTQSSTSDQTTLPSAFDTSSDLESMTDEEIDQVAAQEQEATQTISFNHARENSIVYESLPEGIDAKQLQTQHPNSNVQVMVEWLSNRAAASLGLSKIFALGNPDDSNFRANQLFTFPVILELQKQLEQICDWTFRNWLKWMVKKNIISDTVLSYDLDDEVSWVWKGIDTLDPVANENANELKLKNLTSTYKQILGQDWKDKLGQISEEIAWCKEHHLPHPAFSMISGGERSESLNYNE